MHNNRKQTASILMRLYQCHVAKEEPREVNLHSVKFPFPLYDVTILRIPIISGL